MSFFIGYLVPCGPGGPPKLFIEILAQIALTIWEYPEAAAPEGRRS